jgi:hypothetical protein
MNTDRWLKTKVVLTYKRTCKTGIGVEEWRRRKIIDIPRPGLIVLWILR